MPSAPIAGFKGKIGVGGTPTYFVQIKDIQLTTDGETYDVTVMSGLSTPAWKAFLAGLLSWDLKLTLWYDQANDASQGTIWTALTTGATTAITYSPNTGTNNFTGNVIVKQFALKTPVNGPQEISFDLQGTGALAYL